MIALKKLYRVIALPLFQDNYSYIIQGTALKSLVLVDPANPTTVLAYLHNNFPQHVVSHVLYTHKHWDHAGGSQQLCQELKKSNPAVQLVIGEHDRQAVKGANYSLPPDQDIIIGKSRVRTIHVPCHTRGHTIYTFLPLEGDLVEQSLKTAQVTVQGKKVYTSDSQSCTFTGDTLFVGGIGRFFEGNAQQMTNNIQNMLNRIDQESDIFCGHEYAIANLQWGMQVEKQNEQIREFYTQLQNEFQVNGRVCSVPSSLKKQREINVFVRAISGSPLHAIIKQNPAELLKVLREMKNKNITIDETQKWSSL